MYCYDQHKCLLPTGLVYYLPCHIWLWWSLWWINVNFRRYKDVICLLVFHSGQSKQIRSNVSLAEKVYIREHKCVCWKMCVSVCDPFRVGYLLQCSLDIDALAPRCRRVGKTFTSISTARNVYPLPAEILEGCGHHFDTIICKRSCVLHNKSRVDAER